MNASLERSLRANTQPLSDSAALRVVGYYTDYAGFIDALRPDGQVWSDVNSGDRTGGRIALRWEATENLTVTPRGGLLLCEDSGNSASEGERLIGLRLDGTTFTFGMNNINLSSAINEAVPARDYRGGEFAGACYSPDGQWLFVNVQSPGVTFAITGPWGMEPL